MSRLPKNVVRRGNRFQLRMRVNGRVVRESLGDDLTEARQRAAQLRQKYETERATPGRPRAEQGQTVATYADVWLKEHVAQKRTGRGTERDTKSRLKNHVLPVLGRRKLEDVSTNHLADLVATLREKGLSERTVGHVLSDVRALLNHARRHGHLDRVPFVSDLIPRIKRRQPQALTEEEFDAVLAHTKTPDERFVIEFAVQTGLRRAELSDLHWRHVRLKISDPEFVVETSKSGEPRTVHLTPDAAALLREQKGRSAGLLVSPLRYEQLGKLVHRIRLRSGVRWRWHQLRHTYAQRFLDAGGSVEALSRILGHAEITTTAIYARPSDRLVRNEVRRVWMEQERLIHDPNGSQNGSQG